MPTLFSQQKNQSLGLIITLSINNKQTNVKKKTTSLIRNRYVKHTDWLHRSNLKPINLRIYYSYKIDSTRLRSYIIKYHNATRYFMHW